MATYTYKQIKNAARQARAELFQKGQTIEKTVRSKPREKEKVELLMEKALNRIKRYKPYRREGMIVLPYFFEDFS